MCVITTCKEFQVLRYIYVDYKAKVGEKAHCFHKEVVQRWIAPNGTYSVMARLRNHGYYGT